MAGDSTFDDPAGVGGPRQSLDIGSLLSEGVDRLLSVTGAQLVVVLSVLGFVSTVLWQSLFMTLIEEMLAFVRETVDPADPQLQTAVDQLEQTLETIGLTLDVSIPVILAGLLVLALVGEAVMIVAARAFAADELDGIPAGLATRRLTIATIYGFLGGIVVAIGIVIGALFFFIPGVIVYIGTLFFRQEVAIADKGPLQAISGTWELTKGNRWFLLALAIVLLLIGFGMTLVIGFLPGTVGTIVSTVATSVVGVFSIAVITEAYVRLRGTRDAEL